MKMDLKPTTHTIGMVESSRTLTNGQQDTEIFGKGSVRPELDQSRGRINEAQRWDERPNEKIIHQNL